MRINASTPSSLFVSMRAPAAISAAATAVREFLHARSSGVSPCSFTALVSAPAAMRRSAVSVLPDDAARCSAVFPAEFFVASMASFPWAFAMSRSALTTPRCPKALAKCSGCALVSVRSANAPAGSFSASTLHTFGRL